MIPWEFLSKVTKPYNKQIYVKREALKVKGVY
jgi:hypothetical protein